MKLFLIAGAALVLAACAASSPRIEPARLEALAQGRTTYDEVVKQFGKPSVISNNVDGTRTVRYLYAPAGASANAMMPLLTTAPSDSTTFYFDQHGVLTDYKYTEAERAAPAPAAAAAAQTANEKAPPKPAAAQAPAPKKPLPPNVTDRWPGSTTENR